MGIFANLGKFGLKDFEDAKVLEEEKSSTNIRKKKEIEKNQKSPLELEKEAIFERRYECPVCDINFETKCVRAGKTRLVGKDTDLRPKFTPLDPIKYEVITCENCGYSALNRFYGKLANRQIMDLKTQVAGNFKGIESGAKKEIFTYDDALDRFQLALVTCIVKRSKNSERAYTCLKYAWALRGKRETMSSKDKGYEQLYLDEMECIQNAYDGFLKAISSETFPIAGMDENTLKYVLADLARRLKKYEEALKLVGGVITSRAVSDRLKDEALKLKDMIRDEARGIVTPENGNQSE